MKSIKHTLGFILILIYLTSCIQRSTVVGTSSEISPATPPAQAMTPIPPDPATPLSTTAIIDMPSVKSVTNSVSDQQTLVATTQSAEVMPGKCLLIPVTQPPWPEKTFTPNELDSETGLHITGHPQQIDLVSYRLLVTGLVDHPLSLNYDELRCMPKITDNPELVCPGVFTDHAVWTGVPIKHILELAGVQDGATEITLVSADGYEVNLPLDTARADENFLAYEVNGKPLPVQHGFPLRAVFSSMWGSYWLKWLVEIRIS